MAFFFEDNYRILVRHFFKFFQKDKINFIGNDFHFPSLYFVVSFGLFSVILTMLLRELSTKARIIYLVLAIILFFITTITTSYIDSFGKVVECTICNDGVRSLNYNEVKYDFHFFTSIVVGVLPLFLIFLKK